MLEVMTRVVNDGIHRLSSHSNNHRVLEAYNITATIGDVQIDNWSHDVNQEWAFSSKENNTYRIVPRTAWWRVNDCLWCIG